MSVAADRCPVRGSSTRAGGKKLSGRSESIQRCESTRGRGVVDPAGAIAKLENACIVAKRTGERGGTVGGVTTNADRTGDIEGNERIGRADSD